MSAGKIHWADFGIIVALPEEFAALHEAIPELKVAEDPGARTFYSATLTSATGDKRYRLVAAFLHQMGPIEAALGARDLIERFNPAHIIMVGIAGGMSSDVKLGDVVVSRSILYYEQAKLTESGPKYRPQIFPADTRTLDRALRFMLDPAAMERWRRDCKWVGSDAPAAEAGTIASGDKVLADPAAKKALLQLHSKLIAIDMEGAGVFAAVLARAEPSRCLMIRGISDSADPSKDQTDQAGIARPAARTNAARFLRHFIEHGGIAPLRFNEFRLDPTLTLKIDRRLGRQNGHAYPCFPKLLRPHGPIADLTVTITAEDLAGGPLTILRAVWIEGSGEDKSSAVFDCHAPRFMHRITERAVPSFGLHLEIAGEPARIRVVSSSGPPHLIELKPR